MAIHIARRKFVVTLGGAAAWPFAVRAQQAVMPVIGILNGRASGESTHLLAAIREGLKETGLAEGQNITIEYRFADYQNERLALLAADLVHRQVTVIVATGTSASVAAKAATSTVPIVFEMGSDPVRLGVVASLNRPGGNITGVTNLNVEVTPKRLEFLHELVPTARVLALLVNPTNPVFAEAASRASEATARILGVELHVLNASSEGDFDAAFTSVTQVGAGGLVIGPDTLFPDRRAQLAALALRHRVPTVFEDREFVAAGGLMSYSGNLTDSYRLTGIYAGRVVKGEKPGDLPVQRSTKVEMFVNLKTAKALGVTVPLPLLGRADEVIE
jgi:putative ABC transport system substrate-binding protein